MLSFFCLYAILLFSELLLVMGITLIVVIWNPDHEVLAELREIRKKMPGYARYSDYRVHSGMRFEDGKYVLTQRLSTEAMRQAFPMLRG